MKGQEEETRNTASLLQFRLVCTKDESHNSTENHDCSSASSLYTHTHTCMLSIRQALCTAMPCCTDIVPGRIHWPTCVEKVSSLHGRWQPPFISSTDSVSFRTLSPHMISHWCSYFVSQNENLRTVITASRLSSCRRSTVPSSVSIQEDLRTKGVLLTLHFFFCITQLFTWQINMTSLPSLPKHQPGTASRVVWVTNLGSAECLQTSTRHTE